MKVTHLTSVHPAHDVRIFYREAVTLARAGYDVSVVAPANGSSEQSGVRVVPVPVPVSRRERFLRTVPAVYRAARRQHAHIYHLHDPELLPIGLLLKLQGHRLVYDAHEDYRLQIRSKEWIPPFLRRIAALGVGLFEALASRSFDAIVAATPSIAKRFGAPKTHIVQNFPDETELSVSGSSSYLGRASVALYLGLLADARGAHEMVDAIGLVPDHLAPRLVVAGGFESADLRKRLEASPGWRRVDYRGKVDRQGVDHLLSRARVGLVVLHPLPNYLESYPIKLFECMQAGIPVIVSDFPLWRRIVTTSRCGVVVRPQDARSLAEALTWVFEHPDESEAMGRRGREAARSEYSWASEAPKLLSLYAALGRRSP